MDWLTRDWHVLLPDVPAHMLLALTSVFCGALVGGERRRKEKPAGARTMVLICLGATIYTMLSLRMEGFERSRIAGQVVVGIGFLGAGVILRDPSGGISGITTAASIWTMAAVGLVIGFGYAPAGFALSLLVYAVLTAGAWMETRVQGRCRYVQSRIVFRTDGGKTRLLIDDAIDEHRPPLRKRVYGTVDAGRESLELCYCHRHREHGSFLLMIARMQQVEAVTLEDAGGRIA